MTRLGSPAGSFVQSPARAFLQESAVQDTGLATVRLNPSAPLSSWALYPGCILQATASGNVGNDSLRLIYNLNFGEMSPAGVMGALHVGRSSGTSWRPTDDLLAFSCAIGTPGLTDYEELWVDPSSVTVGSGEVHKEIARMYRDPVELMELYVNWGEFPGASLPAFNEGELVDVFL